MLALIISFESLKICVFDKKTNEPLEAVQIYTSLTLTFTDHSGCANVKVSQNDSLIIYRIGYKMLTLKRNEISDKVYLQSIGITLKTVNVISRALKVKEVKNFKEDIENTNFGNIINKPIISGFNRDKYNIIVDGAFLYDQSEYLDHPIVIDFDLVENISFGSSQSNAIFGLNSVAGGIDLKLFEIENYKKVSFFSEYSSQNNRFSIGLMNIRNYEKFSYKFGLKGSISQDFLNPHIENTSDSSFYSIISIKHGNFQVGNYFSFVRYGISNSDSRARNILLNPRISYKNYILDLQYSDQKEFDIHAIKLNHTHGGTRLKLYTAQTIYNSDRLYLNLALNRFESSSEELSNYSRILLTMLYSNKLKNFLNYSFSIIPNISDFDKKLKLGFSFLLNKSINDFDFTISQSVKYPSLQQLTFTGTHEAANRYEIANENLREEYSFDFSIGYKHSLNFISISFLPSINYVKDFILLTPLDTIINNLPAYTFSNQDIYFLNANFEIYLIFLRDLTYSLNLWYSKPSREIPLYSKPQIKSKLNYKFLSIYHRAILSDSIYSIFSIALSYSLKKLDLSLLLDNILNENYVEPTNPFKTPSPYRSISVKLRSNF